MYIYILLNNSNNQFFVRKKVGNIFHFEESEINFY